ncbi:MULTISPECIES: MCE family protein [unclassified Aeromicrobium]|uniref:MCE family protein n=1 Tax=unclassified Aeromicrobium TaxID=2633570 RepID=UPI00288B6FC9|nr:MULTISPECIES: MCE family protein [unclassified Aeromicrobium]
MRRLLVAAVVAGLAALSGCGVLGGGVYDTPLPGGVDVGSEPIRITADFDDVLDLVPQSSVKVDDVAVGRVDRIRLNPDGRSARVTLLVNRDAQLPAGTVARLQQTSLLGEKYVALVRPQTPQAGQPIADGTRLGLADTSQAAEVEQVLGSLSMVLNGGGIGQFQEISRELQEVSTGRPEEIRGFLREMDTFVTTLDDRKESITAAIDGLARLSENLEADQDKIVSALEGLSPGMQVLVDQREDLVAMLSALDRLSTVTVKTLDASQDDIVADLKALDPILENLARAGRDLPESLEILLTYPFPDSVMGAIEGDYVNAFIETNFRTLPAGCEAAGCAWAQVEDPNYPDDPMSGVRRKGLDPKALLEERLEGAEDEQDVPPSLLPPTSSPAPGSPAPTIPVPSATVPTPDGSPSPSPSPSPSVDPTTTPREGEQ